MKDKIYFKFLFVLYYKFILELWYKLYYNNKYLNII